MCVCVCVCVGLDLCLIGYPWPVYSCIPLLESGPLAGPKSESVALANVVASWHWPRMLYAVSGHSFIHSFIADIYIAPLQVGLLRSALASCYRC